MTHEPDFEAILSYINQLLEHHQYPSLSPVEEKILRLTWQGLGYKQMARSIELNANTIQKVNAFKLWQRLKQVWGGIRKSTFKEVMLAEYQAWLSGQGTQANIASVGSQLSQPVVVETTDRTIPSDTCRLFVVTGAMGIGKTTYVKHLIQQVRNSFDYQFVCEDASYIPTWRDWYQHWIEQTQLDLPDASFLPLSAEASDAQLMQRVMQQLNQRRYLLVIDRAEQLASDAGYTLFLQQIMDKPHQSCLIWVSAFKPQRVKPDHHVILEQVSGLSYVEAQRLIVQHYPTQATTWAAQETHWQELVNWCGGNPHLLLAAAEVIQSVYDDHVENLRVIPWSLLGSSFSDTLERWVPKLSSVEWELLYRCALQPMTFQELQAWWQRTSFALDQFVEALEKLKRYHLLEAKQRKGILQVDPRCLRSYTLSKLRRLLIEEVKTGKLDRLHHYSLALSYETEAHSIDVKTYVVDPLADELKKLCQEMEIPLAAKFNALIVQILKSNATTQSYAASNLLTLALDLKVPLTDITWASLTFRHLNLPQLPLQNLDLTECYFADTVLASGLQTELMATLHPEGSALVLGDATGYIQVYANTHHRVHLVCCYECDAPICHLALTNDNMLVVATQDSKIRIWQDFARQPEPTVCFEAPGIIHSVSIRPDGRMLAIGLNHGDVGIWDLLNETWQAPMLNHSGGIISRLAFNETGTILTGGLNQDDCIILWQVNPCDDTYAFFSDFPIDEAHHLILAFHYSEDRLQIVQAISDQRLRIDPPTQVVFGSYPISTQDPPAEAITYESLHVLSKELLPHQAAYSANGAYLVVCDCDRTVQIWHHHQAQPQKSITLVELPHKLIISNDGQRLLCYSATEATLWDLQQNQCLQQWHITSDSALYRGCKLRSGQGLSDAQLTIAQKLGAIVSA
jgi:WD40 repeat protein/uridine kinase